MTSIEVVPIEKIRVVNSRARSKAKFAEIVGNIAKVGLKKPISIRKRDGDEGYDLVCGEGRLEAFLACGATSIPSQVVDISAEDGLLRSLVENLTRRHRSPKETVQELMTLKERGYNHANIASQIGESEGYVSQIMRLIENGEERLIAGVIGGDIPLWVAIEIASLDDEAMQRSLREAYEAGKLRGRSLLKVRRTLEERRANGKDLRHGSSTHRTRSPRDLVRTLQKETQKQELLVKKARLCEEQLRFVVSALRDLMKDENFVTLLRAEKLDGLPKYMNERMQK